MPNRSETAALIIGITSFDSMAREDATAYAKALGESLTELRMHDIPVIWGQIGNGNKIWVPRDSALSGMASRPYGFDVWMEMAFDETGWGRAAQQQGFDHLLHDENHNNDIHLKFLHQYGPRRNEVVYCKPTMDTLLHPDDIKKFGTAYRDELLRQAGKQPHENDADKMFQSMFKDPSLAAHLHQQGFENVLVMGAMANFCCTETAISSALKGFNTTIATDRVLGWDRSVSTAIERLNAE